MQKDLTTNVTKYEEKSAEVNKMDTMNKCIRFIFNSTLG